MSNRKKDLTPAALYARVSSDRQDVDLSVSAQLRALRDYAKNNGYLVVCEYVDEAESGRIADRLPQGDRRGRPLRLRGEGDRGQRMSPLRVSRGKANARKLLLTGLVRLREILM